MLFIKSVAIGFSIAAPVGPIGLLCIQRSLKRGFCSGFATGIGAACADTVYGLLGAIGIVGIATGAPPLLATALKIGGGAFLMWLAWSIANDTKKSSPASAEGSSPAVFRDFLTTFGLTLSNPMTILSFIGIFAALGPVPAAQRENDSAVWAATSSMVAGVFIGSAAWWLCLSGTAAVLRRNMPTSFMHGIARLSALVIGVFGLVQVITGLRLVA